MADQASTIEVADVVKGIKRARWALDPAVNNGVSRRLIDGSTLCALSLGDRCPGELWTV